MIGIRFKGVRIQIRSSLNAITQLTYIFDDLVPVPPRFSHENKSNIFCKCYLCIKQLKYNGIRIKSLGYIQINRKTYSEPNI